MLTGEETLIPLAESIQELAPDSWSESELIFQPRTLMYGVYKLIFHSRMWDVNDADPLFTRVLPFAKVIWFHWSSFLCWYYISNFITLSSLFVYIFDLLLGYLHVYWNCSICPERKHGRGNRQFRHPRKRTANRSLSISIFIRSRLSWWQGTFHQTCVIG